MSSIRIVNLHKTFARASTPVPGLSTASAVPAHALNGINLDVRDGESMTILGSSGSGKSTLLRCVAGLEDYEGDIFYGEQNMRDVPPKDRGIGIVFQNFALYPNFESKGNLGFFFKLRKREAEIDERVKLTSEIMGIGFDALLARKPGTLSGGQKQRVAVARAICRDPKLLLFDEPLSSLDAQLRMNTRIEIRRLITRFGITTLYVTHDQVEGAIMGDRIAIMDAGRVLQVGDYRELYDQPANTFVAGFLGAPAANLFDGVIEGDGLRALGGLLPLSPSQHHSITASQPVTLGIRPEHLKPSPNPAWITAQIDIVERLPSERAQLCYFDVKGQRLVMRAPQEPVWEAGQMVNLSAVAQHVLMFDKVTGQRV
ncbi:MAG: ABC transporter ATP-binding protein [Anaerolineae bacterium]|nr:ABC transporter ATP-binding protein [Anaerolineae bacterium]